MRAFHAAVLAAVFAAATPAQAGWITSWSAAPVRPMPGYGAMFAAPSFRNQTLVQTLRISAGGKALRIRLTNAYGETPLEIGGARVALLDAEGKEVPGSAHMLTFAGRESARVAARAPLVSDAIAMAVPDLARLSLQLYVPGETGPCSCHQTGLDTILVSPEGNYLGRTFEPVQTLQNRPFAAAIEVDAIDGAGTIAMLADSITDGIGSTLGANRRWPDYLAERLSAWAKGKWGIANQGISGNRVLNEGFGESGLARLDRDIIALPGVRYVVVFLGVNDLGMAFTPPGSPPPAPGTGLPNAGVPVTQEMLLDGYRQIVARAHDKGIKVIGATIAPYKGSLRWTEQGETVREGINAAIRAGRIFDGWVDFDKAFADPADPLQMRPGYHMGDHLHGTDAGYKAVADSIDLGLFK
ncbi:SGNH/GDSL hydrolase family protein [Sphingobium nicotianae]|uniref:SGNH/GDSL hydrolase family protein n=1 Tax=Sphingobium nicotianae TaxID=2782607 RepID=A0A9X1DF84_9SPHN|nr:SGNH/GDSL hydrolase family protein [Sphingobium nicotianae]MBT2189115.1 SGNH/GDSL hydrolase family protein [Sphingobium nicotianae]